MLPTSCTYFFRFLIKVYELGVIGYEFLRGANLVGMFESPLDYYHFWSSITIKPF